VVSGRVRAVSPYHALTTLAGLEILILSRGTDGSNPAPSSGESSANRIRSVAVRSASAAAEERRGVGTNIGRYVPPLERSGETEDSNPVLSGKESGELPTASAALDDCHRRLSSCAA
jgi:hypothetical protein